MSGGTVGSPLPRDPIADAQRNWERHGWVTVADDKPATKPKAEPKPEPSSAKK